MKLTKFHQISVSLFIVSCKALISSEELLKLNFFSQYSAAIYCPSNAQSPPGSKIKCSAGNCPLVEAHNTSLVGNFYNAGTFQSTGFVVVDHDLPGVVAAFRGADTFGLLTLLNSTLMPCESICSSCQCWTGFYNSWLEVQSLTMEYISQARQIYPSYPIYATGHSLGATQSSFLAAELRPSGVNVELINFASPRVGNLEVAEILSSSERGRSYRVTHTNDFAPRLGATSSGYRHLSPEYWIYRDSSLSFSVAEDDVVMLEGTNNATGNGGTKLPNVLAHQQYFSSNIGACSVELEPNTQGN